MPRAASDGCGRVRLQSGAAVDASGQIQAGQVRQGDPHRLAFVRFFHLRPTSDRSLQQVKLRAVCSLLSIHELQWSSLVATISTKSRLPVSAFALMSEDVFLPIRLSPLEGTTWAHLTLSCLVLSLPLQVRPTEKNQGVAVLWHVLRPSNRLQVPALVSDPASDALLWLQVIVPVHQGIHWALAVINLRDRRLEYFDSVSDGAGFPFSTKASPETVLEDLVRTHSLDPLHRSHKMEV